MAVITYPQQVVFWRLVAILLGIAFLVLLVVFVSTEKREDEEKRSLRDVAQNGLPCPPKVGGLLTSGDPKQPGPFHDMTVAEYQRVYDYLMDDPDLNLKSPQNASINTSSIFIVDLLHPSKQSVLDFLDSQKVQPAREAIVIIFRGDKVPPVVEEYCVGPLSKPSYAKLIVNSQRKNPVPFAYRPAGRLEVLMAQEYILKEVDAKVGHILMESYGGKFTDCGKNCLKAGYYTALGTRLIGKPERKAWAWSHYDAEYSSVFPLDFAFLVNLDDSDPTKWTVEKVWYSGTIYDSLTELANKYNCTETNKTSMEYVHTSRMLKSTQNLRGNPTPSTPQRPPVQIEPDGKRYSIKYRHVKYMDWDFDFRMSSLMGPQVYDIRYRDERIIYELGLAEIAVFYSGNNPAQKVTDFVDSELIYGTLSKSLIPGVDCPEGATFISTSFLQVGMEKPTTQQRTMCVFEHDTGVPLKRHLSYSQTEGGFYGGMADSVLIFRSILTIENYDYIIDFIFHQNGAVETRFISTGYVLFSFYREEELPYGFQLDQNIGASVHHHMCHFKVDMDIGGTSNRYETVHISEEETSLPQISPTARYSQTTFKRHLRETEQEAVYKFNFDTPKYHIVHNDEKKTQYGAPKAYRLHMAGMSKQLIKENMGNEVTIPWARQQLAVTVQKDEEVCSSSPYAMFDSLDPVTNFTNFISNESIVDKDLVFWITLGTHHIPHTEDLPVTTTVGGHLSFFLLPYNYFPECPSVSSRDNIRVEYVTANKPSEGLRVIRNGNKVNTACGDLTLEELVKQRPNDFLETNQELF